MKPNIERYIKFEGDCPHFYLDGEGLVTVGIGCRVWDVSYAQSLPMFVKLTNTAAPQSQIAQEYKDVKECPAGKSIKYYNVKTFLYMPTSERIKLFNLRYKAMENLINEQVCKLDEFPEPAQEVLVDMAFNLGLNRLTDPVTGFPNFLRAFQARDWATAAKESHRLKIQESRNDWAKQTLESLV